MSTVETTCTYCGTKNEVLKTINFYECSECKKFNMLAVSYKSLPADAMKLPEEPNGGCVCGINLKESRDNEDCEHCAV